MLVKRSHRQSRRVLNVCIAYTTQFAIGMTKVNRGKDFERQVKTAFMKIKGVSIDRLKDSMSGYMGDNTICDFIVYKKPYEFYIECKAVHGNTLNFKSDIRPNQWEGLAEKSHIEGVHAGFMIWFIDHDLTVYVGEYVLARMKASGLKSLNIKDLEHIENVQSPKLIKIEGKKKRILYDYDMNSFFKQFM